MIKDGVVPEPFPCSFCHKNVINFEAVFAEGLPYHDHCYGFYIKRELKNLKKKLDLGSLTFAEAQLMKELEYIDNINRNPPKTISKGKKQRNELHYKKQELVCRPVARQGLMQSIQESKLKRLEISRSIRWAWDSFKIMENTCFLGCQSEQILLSDNHDKLPSFPLENSQNPE